jgi:hypothetical protein
MISETVSFGVFAGATSPEPLLKAIDTLRQMNSSGARRVPPATRNLRRSQAQPRKSLPGLLSNLNSGLVG